MDMNNDNSTSTAEPLVSVVIPAYNVENYIDRCLDSIFDQTYSNLEIIIINDKAIDSTGDHCKKFVDRDSRVVYIENAINKGLSSTRNVGISKVSGKYVMFVDSDDFLDLDCIEKMVACALKNDADLIVCGFDYYTNGKRTTGWKTDKPVEENISNNYAFARLLGDEDKMRTVWAKLIRIDVIGELRFPEGNRFGEDMSFTPRLITSARKIYQINSNFYIYNQDGTSLVRSAFNKNKLEMIRMAEEWVDIAKKSFPELLNKTVAFKYTTIIDMCSLINGDADEIYYSEIKCKIQSLMPEIKSNELVRKNDKIKAFLITKMSYRSYRRLRRVIDKIKKN